MKQQISINNVYKVLSYFGLLQHEISGIVPMATDYSSVSRPLLIQAYDGNLLVLNRSPLRKSSESLIWEASLRNQLADFGLDYVPRLRFSRDNMPFCFFDQQFFVLGEFKTGTRSAPPQTIGAKLLNSAQTLARFHTLSAGLSMQGINLSPIDLPYALGDLLRPNVMQEYFCEAKSNLRTLNVHALTDHIFTYESTFDYLMGQISQIRENCICEDYTSLPHAIIHGDYNSRNILYVGDRVSGIIDYDYSRFTLRVQDLANEMISITAFRSAVVFPNADFLVTYLKAYQTASAIPLLSRELSALADGYRMLFLEEAALAIHLITTYKDRSRSTLEYARSAILGTAERLSQLNFAVDHGLWASINDRVHHVSSAKYF